MECKLASSVTLLATSSAYICFFGWFLAACLVFQKSTSSDAITCIFIISALFLTQEAMT
jgi:hypothetical protein